MVVTVENSLKLIGVVSSGSQQTVPFPRQGFRPVSEWREHAGHRGMSTDAVVTLCS